MSENYVHQNPLWPEFLRVSNQLRVVEVERDWLREALIETLAIAERNEAGDFADRARAALAKEAG
jgi:hypothetical protein